MTRPRWWHATLFLTGGLLGCAPDHPTTKGRPPMTSFVQVPAADLAALADRRIFFGHQSVGTNLVDGIRDALLDHPDLGLRVIHTAEPWTVEGAALMEHTIGRNGDPEGKTRAFEAVLAGGGLDTPGTIALHKYCYVDVTVTTDVARLFDDYRRAMRSLQRRHPAVTFVHVTMPLAADGSSAIERWARQRLGRDAALVLNRKRNQYNRLLMAEYGGREPVFDLAGYESTRADGSRTFVRAGTDSVFVLAPEYTSDGGHLTHEARRAIGEQLLGFLARVAASTPAEGAASGR